MGQGAEDADAFEEAKRARWEGAELLASFHGENVRERMRKLKQVAQEAPKGALVQCPTCNRGFIKNHPKQAFCNFDGNHKCKTKFHNVNTPQRRERSLQWMEN